MPILALFRWHGDPDDFIAAYDREMMDAPAVTLDQPQRKLHVFAHAEKGVVIADLWESDDDFRRMFNAEFKQNVAASDWPSEPEIEIYQVHATMP